MSDDFGFGSATKGGTAGAKGQGIDLGGLPAGPVKVDAGRERDAIVRGEALGFTDRGQGRDGRRRRPPPTPTKNLYIRGPIPIVEWFEDYTAERGHRALWQSIEDFRAMVLAGKVP